jgi:hypothetical protein
VALIRPAETPASQAKKGRGETAPTFLIIAFLPVPLHPGSKAFQRCGLAGKEIQCSWILNKEPTYPTAWLVLGSGPVVFEGSSTSSPGSSDSTHTLENLTFPVLSQTQLPTLRRYVLHLRNHSPRSDRAHYDKSIGFGSLAVTRRLKASTAIEP